MRFGKGNLPKIDWLVLQAQCFCDPNFNVLSAVFTFPFAETETCINISLHKSARTRKEITFTPFEMTDYLSLPDVARISTPSPHGQCNPISRMKM